MQLGRENSAYDGVMPGICVRPAQLSDRDQLARLCEALWPESSAEDHARELEAILQGNAPGTMPVIILVAEAREGRLAGFLESVYDPTPTAATRHVR